MKTDHNHKANKTFRDELEAILTDVYIEKPHVVKPAIEAIIKAIEEQLPEENPISIKLGDYEQDELDQLEKDTLYYLGEENGYNTALRENRERLLGDN